MQKHLFILILLTLCCACAQQKLERTSDLSHKRKLLLELAQKYHYPEVGMFADPERIMAMTDEELERVNLALEEKCRQDLLVVAKKAKAEADALKCGELKRQLKALFMNRETYNDFVQFKEMHQATFSLCDSLSKRTLDMVFEATAPCSEYSQSQQD
ncbi:MAG TPA: hypothetical protein PKC76_10415 [Saprospiraceae bacterium]|nr:hypothetical protein [Saprospiraceae bacterium]HMP24537.1 hypothetical protein [Saprospiraceae bacterium]